MPSALDLTEGQVFAGQFRVVKPLAQGGMGAVYVVEQLSTGKKRALKLMLPSAALVDGSRRFEQEARTSSLIPSEHVVDVIAAGVEGPDHIPWLAMELLEGESLESHLEQLGPLEPTRAYEILSQLGHALSAAHDLGVVHRDLKPDNIFLARSRTSSSELMVKVLDFGLATVVEASTRNTTALGSPLWMAPEQTQTNEPITLSTDVWAIGLIVFRMLSGKHYWKGIDGSLVSLMREVVLDPLVPASQRSRELGGAALPAGFDEWFGQCVTRFAAYRFAHARDAWHELHTVLVNAGAATHAPRSLTPPTRASRPPSDAPTADISGATALSASRTLLSPSEPPNALGESGPTKAARGGRGLVLAVLALLALGGGLSYWLKTSRPAPEIASALADAPHAPPLTTPSTSPAPPPPVVAAAAAPEPAIPSAAPLPKHPLKAAVTAPSSKPAAAAAAAAAKPDKPPASLPDLL